MGWWHKKQVFIISAPHTAGPELEALKDQFRAILNIQEILEIPKTAGKTYLIMKFKKNPW